MNEDKNTIGRIGALLVIIAVAVGFGRLAGFDGLCALGGSRKACCTMPGSAEPAAPAPAAPVMPPPAAPAAAPTPPR